ncbi:MAG: hypothetical protein IBJ16_04290 [Chitinophagaceae bacterium]|nr:hypothetical protein [Chitinophagaceae bacterium]
MPSKPISEMTTEELQKTDKSLKLAIQIMGVVLVLMTASSIYIFTQKGFSTTTVLPIVFLPLFTMNMANRKKIKAELLSRNHQ